MSPPRSPTKKINRRILLNESAYTALAESSNTLTPTTTTTTTNTAAAESRFAVRGSRSARQKTLYVSPTLVGGGNQHVMAMRAYVARSTTSPASSSPGSPSSSSPGSPAPSPPPTPSGPSSAKIPITPTRATTPPKLTLNLSTTATAIGTQTTPRSSTHQPPPTNSSSPISPTPAMGQSSNALNQGPSPPNQLQPQGSQHTLATTQTGNPTTTIANPHPSFEDWPLENVGGVPVNSRQLAFLIASDKTDPRNKKIHRQRALRMIVLFMDKPTVEDNDLEELVALSLAADPLISEKLLTAIGSKLQTLTEDPQRLLRPLKDILANTKVEHLNQYLLGVLLDSLMTKLDDMYGSQETLSDLIVDVVVMVLNCLYLSKATGIPEKKYAAYKEHFAKSPLGTLSDKLFKSKDSHPAATLHQAKCALISELLTRIGNGEDPKVKNILVAGKVTLGLLSAAGAIMTFDVSTALSALGDTINGLVEIYNTFEEIISDFNATEFQSKWFEVYSAYYLSLILDIQKASEFVNKFQTISLHHSTSPLGFLVIESTKDFFLSFREGEKRKPVWEIVEQLSKHKDLLESNPVGSHMEEIKQSLLKPKQQQITKLPTALFEKAFIRTQTIEDTLLYITEETVCDVSQEFASFVPCLAEIPKAKVKGKSAIDLIDDFLSPTNPTKVLLILGDAGSGKTLLQRYVVREKWREFKYGSNSIPLYGSLVMLKNPRENAIQELLASSTKNGVTSKDMSFSQEQIQQMESEDRPFIFFFDSFEEIPFRRTSICQSNGFHKWSNSKFIFSCRKEFVEGKPDYEKWFTPSVQHGTHESIEIIQLQPFSDDLRIQYFDRYIDLHPECEWKTSSDFEDKLKKIPSLKDLAATPYMIYLLAVTLPAIYNRHAIEQKATGSYKPTRADVLHLFAHAWFLRESNKLSRNHSELPDDFLDDFSSYLNTYCLKLAKAMLERNTSTLQYKWDYLEQKSNDPTLDQFFGKSQEYLVHVQEAAPIKKTSATTFEFIHKFIYEHFAAQFIFGHIQPHSREVELENDHPELVGAMGGASLLFRSYAPKNEGELRESDFKIFFAMFRAARFAKKLLKQSRMTKRAVEALDFKIERSILLSLSERVHRNLWFKDKLFGLVYLSRHNPKLAQAAANAITILNYAGVSFSNKNLSKIRIPGADMSRSILYGANLTDANLTGVLFHDACLTSCTLNSAKMKAVNFGRLPSFKGHEKGVRTVCSFIGPKGEDLLASGGDDNTVRIWDVTTGSEIHTWTGHKNSVNTVCSVNGPNGECWLASGSEDTTICIWDVVKGSSIQTLTGHKKAITSSCSVKGPNGECWLASGSKDSKIRIWDVAAGSKIKELSDEEISAIHCLCSVKGPNGECWLASGNAGGGLSLWDLDNGEKLKDFFFEGDYSGAIYCICDIESSAGQPLVALGIDDKCIIIWDLRNWSEVKRLPGDGKIISGLCTIEDQNGEYRLVSGSRDNSIYVWNIETGRLIKGFHGHTDCVTSVCSVTTRNGRRWLASGSKDKSVRIWDAEIIEETKSNTEHTLAVSSLCELRGVDNGFLLASGSLDETIRIWDINTGTDVMVLSGSKSASTSDSKSASTPDCRSDIISVCSVDGPKGKRWLASGHKNKTIYVWDLDEGEVAYTLNKCEGVIDSLCSVKGPNGECWLAFVSGDHKIRIWDIKNGSITKELDGNSGTLRSVCCINRPNNETWLAFGGVGKKISIWKNIQTESTISILEGHEGDVKCICSLQGPNDECWLASASGDRTIRIWDAEAGSQVNTLKGHTNDVHSVCSLKGPKGECWLVSGSRDKTIRIWDVATGSEIKIIDGHEDEVNSVCSLEGSSDECLFASGSKDRSIRIWEISYAEIECNMGGQNPIEPIETHTIQDQQTSVAESQVDARVSDQVIHSSRSVLSVGIKFIIGPRRLEKSGVKCSNIEELNQLNRNLLGVQSAALQVPDPTSESH